MILDGTNLESMILDGVEVQVWLHEGVEVFSAGKEVTYVIDTNNTVVEKVKKGNSALSPITFTPAKSGYTFLGWKEDTTANDSVLTSKNATEEITLYAVFKKDVTLTYYNNTNIASTKTGTVYYNNGTVNNPSFAMTQQSQSGWTTRGWAITNTADASITYSNGETITLTDNLTIYGCYSTTITVTYYDNSSSASTKTGTRYYNSGNYKNPSFTLSQASKSGWTARGWSTSNSGNATASYSNGDTFTRDSNITLYGMYYTTITLSYNGNGGSGSTASQSGTIYWAPAGTIGATFSLRSNGFGAPSNHSFSQWAMGSTGGTKYNAGASVTLTSSTTFYAIWTQSRCVSTVTMHPIDCYDRTWERMSYKSLTNNPSNNTFFTLSSDKSYITVNKSCNISVYYEVRVGGGSGAIQFANQYDGEYTAFGVGDEVDKCTGTVSMYLSAGSRIYTRVYNHTATGDGEIVFCVDYANFTFTATG